MTPEFWVDLLQNTDAPQDPYLLHIFISRTATFPYSLRLSRRGISNIQQIPHFVSRLCTLTVLLGKGVNVLLYLKILYNLEMPGLRCLQLQLTAEACRVMPRLAPLGRAPRPGNFPQLLSLITRGDFLSPILAVPTLKKLTVIGRVYSLGTLASILSHCSGNLEDLELITCHTEDVLTHDTRVSFPHLRRLLVHNYAPVWTRTFLQMVACPAKTRLYILAFESALNLALPSSSQLPSFATVSNVAVSFIVASPSNILRITGSSRSESFIHIELKGAKWGPAPSPHGASYLIPDLIRFWGAHQALTSLTLDLLHRVSVTEGDWRLLLSGFSALISLHVRIDNGRPLLRVLHKELLCPELKELTLTCNNGSGIHELFVLAVEFRAANGSRLKRLVFSRPRDDIPGQSVPWSAARIWRLMFAVETLQMKVPPFGWDV
ncbi:hypothetical protein GSI_10846 [Ganoderma sinense ZZ0214-1]|uniref:F-box domain-containing protein n=1 Tax=Ganoderma sinense ZZ0214-1 TaxID=1077348 RepID=A0A2G8S1N7_9APHY|nr:hypothetical protein GSI_10846 [Ganoderma sinense ZZ0214-1]